MVSEAQKKANKKWRDNLSRLDIRVPEELKQAVVQAADREGISVRQFVIKALQEAVNSSGEPYL